MVPLDLMILLVMGCMRNELNLLLINILGLTDRLEIKFKQQIFDE